MVFRRNPMRVLGEQGGNQVMSLASGDNVGPAARGHMHVPERASEEWGKERGVGESGSRVVVSWRSARTPHIACELVFCAQCGVATWEEGGRRVDRVQQTTTTNSEHGKEGPRPSK